MQPQPCRRWLAHLAPRQRADEPALDALRAHSLLLAFKNHDPEREALAEDPRHFAFDLRFLVNVTPAPPGGTVCGRRHIDLQDLKVRIPLTVEQRPPDVLPKDAPVVRARSRNVEVHPPFIEEEMLRYPASEVALLVRAYAHNPRPVPVMPAGFALLI